MAIFYKSVNVFDDDQLKQDIDNVLGEDFDVSFFEDLSLLSLSFNKSDDETSWSSLEQFSDWINNKMFQLREILTKYNLQYENFELINEAGSFRIEIRIVGL